MSLAQELKRIGKQEKVIITLFIISVTGIVSNTFTESLQTFELFTHPQIQKASTQKHLEISYNRQNIRNLA